VTGRAGARGEGLPAEEIVIETMVVAIIFTVTMRFNSALRVSSRLKPFTSRNISTNQVHLSSDLYLPPSASTATTDDKSPLLILHGLFGSKRNWHTLSKAFAHDLNGPVYSLVRVFSSFNASCTYRVLCFVSAKIGSSQSWKFAACAIDDISRHGSGRASFLPTAQSIQYISHRAFHVCPAFPLIFFFLTLTHQGRKSSINNRCPSFSPFFPPQPSHNSRHSSFSRFSV
jgi:hypothetical protein